MEREKLIKGLVSIAVIILLCTVGSRLLFKSGETLQDYGQKNPEMAYDDTKNDSVEEPPKEEIMNSPANETNTVSGPSMSVPADIFPNRVIYKDDFYYEPLNEEIKAKITGVSYPAVRKDAASNGDVTVSDNSSRPETAITYEDLRYVHILHYDFNGEAVEGELICNALIAQDLIEIFYELYRAEYQIERVRLIDEYLADDDLSMENNNTSCFNYRVVEGTEKLSKHAYGLAVDINPFYNPYVRYNKDGSLHIDPKGSESYADRSGDFPFKIDDNDLCLKLFKEHGFTWGGDWNSMKDYQHFQKTFD